MLGLQGSFDQLPHILAVSLLLQGRDLSLEQVESLQSEYQPEEFCPTLRVYISNFPQTRRRSSRGRKRKITSEAIDHDNMIIVAKYFRLRLAPPSAENREGRSPAEWAADQLAAEFNVTPKALLNRVSKLRYYVDMQHFWEFVLKKYGEDLAIQLLEAIKPDGEAFRKKLEAISGPLDEAQKIVSAHARRLQ